MPRGHIKRSGNLQLQKRNQESFLSTETNPKKKKKLFKAKPNFTKHVSVDRSKTTMKKITIPVESLDEEDDFLLQLAAIEAEAAAKRPRVSSIPEGPYMAALKGSKSDQWQQSPLNPASKSRSVAVTTGGFQRSDGGGGVAGEQDFPEKSCPCGVGICLILTSNTPKNPGRKFYKCPNREVLNMFIFAF